METATCSTSTTQQKLALLAALFSALAGCGGGGEVQTPAPTPSVEGATPASAPPASAPPASAPPASAPPASAPPASAPPASAPPASAPPASAPPASAPPASAPPAGTPAAPAPPTGNVATLADFEACPDVRNGFSSPSIVWPVNCLKGKRLVGTQSIPSIPAGSLAVPCELFLRADGAFEYTKGGILYAVTAPYTQWSGLNGFYNNSIKDAALTNKIGVFEAKLGGNPTDPSSHLTDQIRIGVEVIKSASLPTVNSYILAFSVGGIPNLQGCNLNPL
jgi:hypothetical protein